MSHPVGQPFPFPERYFKKPENLHAAKSMKDYIKIFGADPYEQEVEDDLLFARGDTSNKSGKSGNKRGFQKLNSFNKEARRQGTNSNLQKDSDRSDDRKTGSALSGSAKESNEAVFYWLEEILNNTREGFESI